MATMPYQPYHKLPSTKVRTFEVWTYDVWGNAKDGFEVNDRCCINRKVTIRCKAEVFNKSTDMEFVIYEPTDRQLSYASGFRRCQWDGQYGVYEAETANGRPIGQLVEIELP